MDHPGVIALLDLLTFVGAPNDTWATPWVRWPSWAQRRQLVVGMKTVIGRLGVQLQTTWDEDTVVNVGSRLGISIQETRIAEGIADLGPWVRLQLSADVIAPDTTMCIVSAWITPKMT